jgi:DNA-binding GntR family transcriptional regulator
VAELGAAETAYFVLREGIVARRHLPGDVLSRPALTKAVGVSQTPLREALSRLAAEGFVEIRPQSGTRVRPIEVLSLHEGQFLAVALAVEAACRLSGRPGAAEGLSGLVVERFLSELFLRVGMGRLWRRLTPFFGSLERCRALEIGGERTGGQALQDDAAVRIANGDAQGAAAAIRALMSDELAPLARWKARYPEMFV